MLEKILESPLDCKEIQSVHPKRNPSWIFIGRTDAEAETPIFWSPDGNNWLTGKDPDAEKDWRQEEKGTIEDEMVGWHHWLNGHEFEQSLGVGDGNGSLGMLQSMGSQSQTQLEDWTESNYYENFDYVFSSVAQSCPTLQPHEPQHTRPPCPSPTPGVHPNPCPSSWWFQPTISASVVPFSSCPQSSPASESFHLIFLYTAKGIATVYGCNIIAKWKLLSRVQLFVTPWTIQSVEFSRQNTQVGSLSLLQRIFPAQGSNPGLLQCRWILYHLSHKGSITAKANLRKYVYTRCISIFSTSLLSPLSPLLLSISLSLTNINIPTQAEIWRYILLESSVIQNSWTQWNPPISKSNQIEWDELTNCFSLCFLSGNL